MILMLAFSLFVLALLIFFACIPDYNRPALRFLHICCCYPCGDGGLGGAL